MMKKAVSQVTRGLSKAPAQIQHRLIKAIKASAHIKSHALFFKAIIKNPWQIGACWPSSRKLAEAMAAGIEIPHQGLVVELGGGTGVITQAILNRGLPREKLIVVEYSRELARYLSKRFKGVNVICGDAAQLTRLLGSDASQVQTIISSLPLLSLPRHKVFTIEQELQKILTPGCRYIKFTYDVKAEKLKMNLPLQHHTQKTIWFNVPPARVDVYEYASRGK